MEKASSAFRTISEVATELDIPKHVLRFWEGKFPQLRPMKRGGGRRYYRPEDIDLLRGIRALLYSDGYTIKGVQRILRGNGVRFVKDCWREGVLPPQGEPMVNIPNLAEEAASEACRGKRTLGRPSQKNNGASKANGAGVAEVVECVPEIVLPPLSPELRDVLVKVLAELQECRKLLRGRDAHRE